MSWSLLFIPFAYINLFFFSFGIGMIMSILTVFFRDLQHIIVIAMQGLFFLTPIFYRQDNITGKLSWIVDMNPVVPFIELFRAPLYLAHFPDSGIIIRACILSIIAFFLGLYIFFYQEKKIVFRL
jgi:ABC-type polysaccharide/polyol phosphate export permease